MKVFKPRQIPANPQPNINDSHVKGGNTTNSMITVASGMNFACATGRLCCRADRRLRGDLQRIQHQRKEIPQLRHQLIGRDGDHDEPDGDSAG